MLTQGLLSPTRSSRGGEGEKGPHSVRWIAKPQRLHRLAARRLNFRKALSLAWLALAASAWGTPDLRFDVVTFCCGCTSTSKNLCQAHFDHLNFPTPNGHYLAMGNDDHRAELQTNGNLLAIYYNTLNTGWTTNDGPTTAAAIEQYSQDRFTSTGPRPDWIVLNEISASQWPDNPAYRTWVHDVVHALRNTYGYSVILYAPFANPGANGADWQAVAADAYIGVENYLSGEEVQAQNFSVSWCQSKYQSSITSYNARGVATSRLILGEYFAHNLAGAGYGRSGVSSNAWDRTIIARSEALQNTAFPGFIGYAWGDDALNVSTEEMVHFEDTYAAYPLPANVALTPPYIIVQPPSQTVAPGATVTFDLVRAGNAPLSYQWRRNGNSLPGRTAATLTLTNVWPADAGSYTVLLSNTAGSTLSSNAVLSVTIPEPIVFEPFANATASGGTAYTVGANLTGQTNAQGFPWYVAGTSATGPQPLICAGSLSVPGLAVASGNSVIYGNTSPAGAAPRMNLGATYSAGTLYYSCAFLISNLANLGTGLTLLAGFNNSAGQQSGQPTVYGAWLVVRRSGSGYNIGLNKADGLAADTSWDTAVHLPGDTLFIVGSYTLNTGTTDDDTSALWINPPYASFGTATAPAPTLTAFAGNDISAGVIRSFLLRDAVSTEPVVVIDELRLGDSWASVTPPAPVPASPELAIRPAGSQLVLSWPTNAVGFTLESAAAPSSGAAWLPVGSPVYAISNQFVTTNNVGPSNSYFRLRWP